MQKRALLAISAASSQLHRTGTKIARGKFEKFLLDDLDDLEQISTNTVYSSVHCRPLRRSAVQRVVPA